MSSAKRQKNLIFSRRVPSRSALARGDEIGERAEVDAASGFDGLHAERQGQVAFAGAGRSEEVHDLCAIDELQLGERHDAVLVERGLEGEVEAGERLDGREPRHEEGGFDAAVLAQRQFLGEQRVDCLDGGHLALLDADAA